MRRVPRSETAGSAATRASPPAELSAAFGPLGAATFVLLMIVLAAHAAG